LDHYNIKYNFKKITIIKLWDFNIKLYVIPYNIMALESRK